MTKRQKGLEEIGMEINIPFEFVEKIDKIIDSGKSPYLSVEDFVKRAVEMKLTELK